MTGRERLLGTIRGEEVDRLPISPFLYFNAVYEMFGHKPDITGGFRDYFHPKDFDAISKFVEYCDYFGFDVMHVLGSPWRVYDLCHAAENWRPVLVETGDNDARWREITITTPAGELRQTQNVTRSSTYLVVGAVSEHLIKTAADFDMFRKYCPGPDSLDYSGVTRSREATGDKGLVCPIIHGAFNMLCTFRKIDDVMMDPVTDEGLYREMIGFFADWVAERAVCMVRAGADAVEIGGNMAGSAVGPAFFERYVRPYEQRIVDAVHSAGAYLVYHNCGDGARIMHLYNDMNIDVLGYLTPPPFGDVDLDEALRVLRPSMALRGNIDQVEFIPKSTPDRIERHAMEVAQKARRRGRFIMSTTDFFFDETPYANVAAFVRGALAGGA